MYLIGLTGGIASGKSTVAKCWVDLGGIEIDADQLARDVVQPGQPALDEIRSAFGDEVFAGAELDRAALGRIVFADSEKRKQLESIVHPRVKAAASQAIAQLPRESIVIYNVPLLVEASVDLPFNKIVTVEAPAEKQIQRLIEHRGMPRDEAEKRVAAQASPAQRANVADVILNSNQDIHLLLHDATALWRQIQNEAAN